MPEVYKHEDAKEICSVCFNVLNDLKILCNNKPPCCETLINLQNVTYGFVICAFHEFGCTERIVLSKLEKHESQCQFRKVSCGFAKSGCRETSKPMNLENHEENCKFRTTSCIFASNGCNRKIRLSNIQKHENKCEFRMSLVMTQSFNEDIIRCGKCSKIVMSPMFHCAKGHLICKSCKEDGFSKLCPCGAVWLSLVPNTPLLRLIQEINEIVIVPCCFYTYGCEKVLKLSEKDNHERECDFRDFNCEISLECSWKGKKHAVVKHVSENHKKFLANMQHVEEDTFAKSFLIKLNNANMIKLLICRDSVFYLRQKIEKGEVFFIVQFLGTPNCASSYNYTMEVKNQNKRVSIDDMCNSDSDDFLSIMSNRKCIIFLLKDLKKYENSSGGIQATINITKYSLESTSSLYQKIFNMKLIKDFRKWSQYVYRVSPKFWKRYLFSFSFEICFSIFKELLQIHNIYVWEFPSEPASNIKLNLFAYLS